MTQSPIQRQLNTLVIIQPFYSNFFDLDEGASGIFILLPSLSHSGDLHSRALCSFVWPDGK